MTEDRLAFGRALAAARKARGHSQAELGRRIGGVVQATISSWETGVTEPTPFQVFAMEEALGIEGGQLSKHLGYIPASRRVSSNPRAADYISDDPNLEPWAKRVLLGVYQEVAKPRLRARSADFQHAVFFHYGRDEYFDGVSEYIRQGLGEQEPVVVMAGEENSDLLSTMGRDAARVNFWEDWNPGRCIGRWQHWLGSKPDGLRAVQDHSFVVGVVQSGKTASLASLLHAEWHRHEVLLNTAFSDGPSWTLLCPYDLSAVDDETAERARHSHPLIWGANGPSTNPDYIETDPAETLELPLPEPPEYAMSTRFDPGDWQPSMRPIIELANDKLGGNRPLDFVMAVKDVATAGAQFGRGGVTLTSWREPGIIAVEIKSGGKLPGPMVDRVRGDGPDWGLVQANNLCDLVVVRSTPAGPVVRVCMLETSAANRRAEQLEGMARAQDNDGPVAQLT